MKSRKRTDKSGGDTQWLNVFAHKLVYSLKHARRKTCMSDSPCPAIEHSFVAHCSQRCAEVITISLRGDIGEYCNRTFLHRSRRKTFVSSVCN